MESEAKENDEYCTVLPSKQLLPQSVTSLATFTRSGKTTRRARENEHPF